MTRRGSVARRTSPCSTKFFRREPRDAALDTRERRSLAFTSWPGAPRPACGAKGRAMTKQQLIERVYRKRGLTAGITKKAVADIVDGMFAELGDYFIKSKATRAATPRFTYPG